MPALRGPWAVESRRGVNVQVRNNDSGVSKWVHLNRCKRVPHWGGDGGEKESYIQSRNYEQTGGGEPVQDDSEQSDISQDSGVLSICRPLHQLV